MPSNKIKINVRADFDPRPIRHLSVECPECKNWFFGNEFVREVSITEDWQLNYAEFDCPICGASFGNGYADSKYEYDIEEADYPDVYKDCKRKKNVWE